MFLLPLTVLLVQLLATALVVGFTLPSSTLRVGILPLVAICTWISVSTCRQYIGSGPWTAVAGGYSATYLLQYLSLALFRGRTFETQTHSKMLHRRPHGADKPDLVADTYFRRLKYGLAAASTFRNDDMRNVPVFSSKQPDSIPSRPAFLRWTFIKIIACYIVLDMLGLGADAETNMKKFSARHIPLFSRLSEVSAEEFAIRVFSTLATGICIYCSQEGLQSLLALAAVGVGISDVRSWRPRFGSLHDAYTVRRFWKYV